MQTHCYNSYFIHSIQTMDLFSERACMCIAYQIAYNHFVSLNPIRVVDECFAI